MSIVKQISVDNLHVNIADNEITSVQSLLNNKCNWKEKHENKEEKDKDKEVTEETISVNLLKKLVIRWITLDDHVKEMSKEMKEFKDEKTQIEDKILNFMKNTSQDEIPVKNEKLKRKKSETKEKIDEEYIKKCLIKNINDVEAVDKLTNIIMTNRAITETYKLARIGKK